MTHYAPFAAHALPRYFVSPHLLSFTFLGTGTTQDTWILVLSALIVLICVPFLIYNMCILHACVENRPFTNPQKWPTRHPPHGMHTHRQTRTNAAPARGHYSPISTNITIMLSGG